MKKLKFLFALLVVMIAFCWVPQVHASTKPVFSVDKVTAMSGDKVNVGINVQNNPGIASIKLKIQYDEANMMLKRVTYNEDIGGEFMQPQKLTSPVTLNWYNGSSDSEGDWTYATLQFQVSSNTKAGSYPITISYEADNVYDITETNINFAIKNGSVTVEVAESEEKVYRVAGATRYETAFETAEALKNEMDVEKFDAIIVTCGTNFPDALSGTYLAAEVDAPIILTNGRNVEKIITYVKNNLVKNGTVYLLGDSGVVPVSIETGLRAYEVIRLGGATRYETNLEILNEVGVSGKDILVCTGMDYADSLSAAATGLPILIVKDKLNASQKSFLKTVNGDIYVIGGTAAVNEYVESELRAYGSVKRIGGANRYETSVLIAKEFFTNPKEAVLAYSKNFPDGLCGGALAYNINAPLILTATGKEAVAVVYTNRENIQTGYVLGSDDLISDNAVKNVFNMSSKEEITIWQ